MWFPYCCLLFLLFCYSPLCFTGLITVQLFQATQLHWLHFSVAKARDFPGDHSHSFETIFSLNILYRDHCLQRGRLVVTNPDVRHRTFSCNFVHSCYSFSLSSLFRWFGFHQLLIPPGSHKALVSSLSFSQQVLLFYSYSLLPFPLLQRLTESRC